jgi:hypothetical protein
MAYAMTPSSEPPLGLPTVAPRRRSWVPVEIVAPGPEGRAPRLVRALRECSRAFVFSPLPGYGIAAVCRSCGRPAACAVCQGSLRSSEGSVRCVVCEAPGRCRTCGASDFGLVGGRNGSRGRAGRGVPAPPGPTTPACRRRRGPRRRPHDPDSEAGGSTVAISMISRGPPGSARVEPSGDRGDRKDSGRAIAVGARTTRRSVPVLATRASIGMSASGGQAGFPVGAPVFRVVGDEALPDELAALDPITLLVSTVDGQTVCLLALDPGAWRRSADRPCPRRARRSPCEAEPHLARTGSDIDHADPHPRDPARGQAGDDPTGVAHFRTTWSNCDPGVLAGPRWASPRAFVRRRRAAVFMANPVLGRREAPGGRVPLDPGPYHETSGTRDHLQRPGRRRRALQLTGRAGASSS